MFELYYTYSGTDYKIYPLDVTEGIGWKNIQGFPCNSITVVDADTAITPGRYRISYDEVSLGVYNEGIETCTLYFDNRSSNQIACYENVRLFSAVLITCVNAPETVFSYDNEVDNLEGNSNEDILVGLGINLNEFPTYPGIFDVFCGGFYIEEEGRYLIPLDFGYLLRGDTGEAKSFTIKATTSLNNCVLQITDKGDSEGSFVWDIRVNSHWYSGNTQIDIGDFATNDMLDIDLRCYIPYGWTEDTTEGYLTITADEGSVSIPLRVGLLYAEAALDGEITTDGDIFFRCVVMSSSNINKLAEFGITEAS